MSAASRRAFVAAASALLARPARSRAADAGLSVGIPPGYMGAIADYGIDRGFFANAGISLQRSVLNSGAVIATAVTGGSIDLGAVNVGSLASARLRGVPLRIVAPSAVVSRGYSGDAVLVTKSSPLRPGPDFNGKTVAIVALKTVQHAAFLAWLERRGADPSSVKMFEMPLPEMAAALDAGRVDAAITVEPFTTEVLASHRAFGSLYEAMTLPFLIFAFCASESWLTANADAARRFAGAVRQAGTWANGHQAECRRLLASTMKLSPAVADAMSLPIAGTSLDPALIQPVIDVMVKYGFLAQAVAPSEMIWSP